MRVAAISMGLVLQTAGSWAFGAIAAVHGHRLDSLFWLGMAAITVTNIGTCIIVLSLKRK